MAHRKQFQIRNFQEGDTPRLLEYADWDLTRPDSQGFLVYDLPSSAVPELEKLNLKGLLSGLDGSTGIYNDQEVVRKIQAGQMTGYVPGLHHYHEDESTSAVAKIFDYGSSRKKVPANPMPILDVFKKQCNKFEMEWEPNGTQMTEDDAIEQFLAISNRYDKLDVGESVSAAYLIIKQSVKVQGESERLGLNLDELHTDFLWRWDGGKHSGINSTWLYIAPCGAPFPLHREDKHGVSSLNICYASSGYKVWLFIARYHNDKLFEAVRKWLEVHKDKKGSNRKPSAREEAQQKEANPFCHKTLFISVDLLDKWGIDHYIVPQAANRLILTGNGIMHQGINIGSYVVNKALNICTREYAMSIGRFDLNVQCRCSLMKNDLKFDVQTAEKFQSAWKKREKSIQRLDWKYDNGRKMHLQGKPTNFVFRVHKGEVFYGTAAYSSYYFRKNMIRNKVRYMGRLIRDQIEKDDKNAAKSMLCEALKCKYWVGIEAAIRILVQKRSDMEDEAAFNARCKPLQLELFTEKELHSLFEGLPEGIYRLYKQKAILQPEILSLAQKNAFMEAAVNSGRGDRILHPWNTLRWTNKDERAVKARFFSWMKSNRQFFPSVFLQMCYGQETRTKSTECAIEFLQSADVERPIGDKPKDPILMRQLRKAWIELVGEAKAEHLELLLGIPPSWTIRENPPVSVKTRKERRNLEEIGTQEHHSVGKGVFACSCDPTHHFLLHSHLVRHILERNSQFSFNKPCFVCKSRRVTPLQVYMRKDHYTTHWLNKHKQKIWKCNHCRKSFVSPSGLLRHKTDAHGRKKTRTIHRLAAISNPTISKSKRKTGIQHPTK